MTTATKADNVRAMPASTAQTQAITVAGAAIEPANMNELRAMAQAASASRFFGAATPEQALMLMMAGRDLGLSYVQSLRAFHVIEGKPSLSAQGMVAVCLKSGICDYFEVVERTDQRATVRAKRAGRPEHVMTFSIDDAKRAGLVGKGNWAKYPAAMLVARAQAALAREVFPDLLLGLYTDDEMSQAHGGHAQPSPVFVDTDGVVVESGASAVSAADPWLRAIAEARTLDELRGRVADSIKSANLDRHARDRAIAAYRAREAELKAAPEHPPAEAEVVTAEAEVPA
jgi:hypothetical protein